MHHGLGAAFAGGAPATDAETGATEKMLSEMNFTKCPPGRLGTHGAT